MAKPPETPPSSDIGGADRDRRPTDQPDHDDPKQTQKLQQEEEEARARPRDSRP